MEKTLKEQEAELRLFLQSVEEQIEKFLDLKERLLEKRDELREELHKNDLGNIPIKFKFDESEDLIESVEEHLMELNKLRAYINAKLKKVLDEERALEVIKSQFPGDVKVEPGEHGFEIIYKSPEFEGISEALKSSKEKISKIRESLRNLEGKTE